MWFDCNLQSQIPSPALRETDGRRRLEGRYRRAEMTAAVSSMTQNACQTPEGPARRLRTKATGMMATPSISRNCRRMTKGFITRMNRIPQKSCTSV